jgi:hypothetical protein
MTSFVENLICGEPHLWELTNLEELAQMWLVLGNELEVAELATCEGARWVPEAMSMQRAQYEQFAWWLARERIGHDLRERYPPLPELPPRLLALVRKLDASQGNQLTQEMPSGWLRKLDAMEGNQLLQACKKRLRARDGEKG